MKSIDIKKEYRCTPTFVNLKSNTMKNTLQRYGLLGYFANYPRKKSMFYNTSYVFSSFPISFLRISAFSFLIHEAFDALLGGLFKFLKVYLHFGYLAVCRQ